MSKLSKPSNRKPHPSKAFKPTATCLKTAGTRAKPILRILRKVYPDAACSLKQKNPLQLLIATILSAQCTDARVNIVCRDLFRKFRSAASFAEAAIPELEQDIRSTGFFRNKAKNIKAACSEIVERFGGKVPDTREQLTALPGVGRKTANLVLGDAFGKPAVVTDTHVIRLSRLLGLSKHADPVKLEFDLMELFPKNSWTLLGHLLIFHGRRICIASRPDCDNCLLEPHCCYAKK